MLKSQLLFGVSLAALGVAAAELAPYVPAPHQFQRVQTCRRRKSPSLRRTRQKS